MEDQNKFEDSNEKSDSFMQGFSNLKDGILENVALKSKENDVPMESLEKSIVLNKDETSLGVNNLDDVNKNDDQSVVVGISTVEEMEENETGEPSEKGNTLPKHKVYFRDTFKCVQCDKLFNTILRLKIHNSRHHKDKKCSFQCAICKTKVKKSRQITGHMRGHKLVDKMATFKELGCTVNIEYDDSFEINVAMDCRPGNFICFYCQMECKTWKKRLVHMDEVHMVMSEDIRGFPCPHCTNILKNGVMLRSHIEMKHMYLCSVCPTRSMSMKMLQVHVQKDHEMKSIQCQWCDMTFPKAENLKRHLYLHTGEKPYRCNVCSASYTKSYRLNQHKRYVHNIEPNISAAQGKH